MNKIKKLEKSSNIKTALKRVHTFYENTDVQYLNCRHVALLIGKSHTWVWNMINEGYIKSENKKAKDGKKIYKSISIESIQEFLENYSQTHKKPINAKFKRL